MVHATFATIVVLLVILVLSVLPIMVGAAMVGAERRGLLWSLLAMIVSGVLHSVGLTVPGIGTLIAFFLAGVGFAWILETTIVRGIIIHIVQLVFWAVFGVLASILFGISFGLAMFGAA